MYFGSCVFDLKSTYVHKHSFVNVWVWENLHWCALEVRECVCVDVCVRT